MHMIYLCIAILFVIISGFVSSDWSTTIHNGNHYRYSPSMRLSQCLYVCIITIHQQMLTIITYVHICLYLPIIIIIIITIISDL